MALGRILNQWDDIIGPELAVKAQPNKIHYRKPKTPQDKPQATLDIAVSSADATLLHYQKDLILERLNQLFGENWITAIRFVHLATNENAEMRGLPQKTIRLDPTEIANLKGFLSVIEDEDLKKRLEIMGQSVLKRLRSKYSPQTST